MFFSLRLLIPLENAHSQCYGSAGIMSGTATQANNVWYCYPGFRTLWPTRWTARGSSLRSIVDNWMPTQLLCITVKYEVQNLGLMEPALLRRKKIPIKVLQGNSNSCYDEVCDIEIYYGRNE